MSQDTAGTHAQLAQPSLSGAHLATVSPTSSSVAYLAGSSTWATTPGHEQSMQSSRLCCDAYLVRVRGMGWGRGVEVGEEAGVGVGLGCGGGGVLDVAVEDTAQEGNGDAGDVVVELARGSGGDRG